MRSVGQWVRLFAAIATLVVLAAPAALGAAMDPVLRMLGDVHGHVCKCGMTPGKCGCPECERAEQERLSEHRTEAAPTLKRHCDDEAPAMPLGAALPAGVLAAASAATLPVPRGDRVPVVASAIFVPSPETEPPTPPPRIATV
ncbi:MAG: hypothetical protein ABSE49_06110 [Polyangiaceae bacterium]